MEFYVKPAYRRQGYASAMLTQLKQHFARHGATHAWLNASSGSEAFWRAMGYAPTEEISPDNNMPVFEKML